MVWLSEEVIPGAPDAVARLRATGYRVMFVTNNSAVRVSDVEAKLARFGIPAADDVLTSALAAATLVRPGERVLVAGGPGAVEAMRAAGAEVVDGDGERPDVVVVGFHRSFDYDGLARASAAVRAGARLVGTNEDATYPTPEGEIPGAGAILASIAYAAGVQPMVAGKPHGPMADLVRRRLGEEAELVMVGDRPDTDGRFARVLRARFALVYSGVTDPGDEPDPAPDLVAPDLAGIVAQLA